MEHQWISGQPGHLQERWQTSTKEFVSVVKKIEVQNADWVTPDLTDNDLPKRITGVIPIGAEAPEGSEGITLI